MQFNSIFALSLKFLHHALIIRGLKHKKNNIFSHILVFTVDYQIVDFNISMFTHHTSQQWDIKRNKIVLSTANQSFTESCTHYIKFDTGEQEALLSLQHFLSPLVHVLHFCDVQKGRRHAATRQRSVWPPFTWKKKKKLSLLYSPGPWKT